MTGDGAVRRCGRVLPLAARRGITTDREIAEAA